MRVSYVDIENNLGATFFNLPWCRRIITFNHILGCYRISSECELCYALGSCDMMCANKRFGDRYQAVTENGDWNRKSFFVDGMIERVYVELARSKTPYVVVPGTQGDVFFEGHLEAHIDMIFFLIKAFPQHTFIIITKRINRAQEYILRKHGDTPLPNLILATSAGNQRSANLRIPALINTPAALHLLMASPLIGDITFDPSWLQRIDWIVASGESSSTQDLHKVRYLNPTHIRHVRDQAIGSGVPFMFQKWGTSMISSKFGVGTLEYRNFLDGNEAGRTKDELGGGVLDKVRWNQFPPKPNLIPDMGYVENRVM